MPGSTLGNLWIMQMLPPPIFIINPLKRGEAYLPRGGELFSSPLGVETVAAFNASCTGVGCMGGPKFANQG